jgi:hypothetical protein
MASLQGSTPGGTITTLADALMLNYDLPFRGKVGWSKGALGAMIKKVRWSGLKPVIPIRNANSPAVSNTFSVAQARAATSTGITKVVQFLPQWYKKFGVAQIDSLLIAAASDSAGAVYDELCTQIDGIMNGTTHQFSTDVYRNGFGAIGTIDASTTIASTRLILKEPEDSVLFVDGMTLIAAPDDHTSAARNSGATMEVAGVEDYEKGYITMTQNLSTAIAAIATGDIVFPEGNRGTGATPAPLALNGLDAWFPTTVPTTTDVASGVDRSKSALLRGTIIDLTSSTKNKEDACLDAITASARYGGNPESMVYFTNNTNYKEILSFGTAKYRPDTTKGPYGISFQGIKIQTDNGEVKVQPDRYCPVKRSYLLDLNTVKFYGCGSAEVPRFIDDDGVGKILRMTDAAAVESRVGYYGTIGCNNPIVNVVVIHKT